MNIRYLELHDLLAATVAYLGRPAEVGDWGLLESALARPKTTVLGQDAYPDIHQKAAALLHSVVRNHALVDGNKRLGWAATYLFYGLNGYTAIHNEDQHYNLIMGVATNTWDTVPKIAHQLAELFIQTKDSTKS